MATVLKLSIFDFCDFWIATSDLGHASTALIFLPYPARSGPKPKCAAVHVL